MPTRISTIAAHVTAQDRGFSATMAKVRDEAKKTKAAVDSGAGSDAEKGLFGMIGDKVTGDGKGLASFALKGLLPLTTAVGVLNEVLSQSKKVLQEVADARDRVKRTSLDAGTLGLSFNEMQAVAVAAAHMGTNIELTSGAIGKMLKLIEEAADGSEEAADTLGKLGLTIGSFKGKTTYEALLLVADGLDQIDNTSSRIYAASKLFGRGAGLTMIDVLSGGSEAMSRYAAEANSAGLAMSDFEVETIKAYKAMQEFRALKKEGIYNKLATDPAIEQSQIAVDQAKKTWSKFWRWFGTKGNNVWGKMSLLPQFGWSPTAVNAEIERLQALREVEAAVAAERAANLKNDGRATTVLDFVTENEKKKMEEHMRLMRQWKDEHDQWLQDFYNSSFDNFASQPGLGGGNTPVWMGMSLNDMKQAYQMQQKMAEWDKAIQDGNERDLIAADQARREKDKELAKMAADSAGRFAPLLISGSAEAQRAAYIASMQSNGVAIDPSASSQAARDKENLRIQRDNARVLKQIEQNTKARASGGVGV